MWLIHHLSNLDGVPKMAVSRRTRRHWGSVLVAVLVSAFICIMLFWRGPSSFNIQRGNDAAPARRRPSFRQVPNTANDSAFVFKILQLADLHMGEGEDTDWGPQQDVNSSRVIHNVLAKEQPDLVVLSGDQLTANNIDENATLYHIQLIQALQNAQPHVQWCLVFGNHDDSPLHQSKNGTLQRKAKTSRQDLVELDMSFKGSWTNTNPGLFGTSNYMIPLFLNDEPVVDLFLLDSGGGSLPQIIQDNQVEWFHNVSSRQNKRLPAIVFQHIPINYRDFVFDSNKGCVGLYGDGTVDALAHDRGVMDAFVQHGNVRFVAVGHDHGNDYCCPYNNVLSMCFGRHSGYGGYGRWDRGARVYELTVEKRSNEYDDFYWKSWVRLESGQVIDTYAPPSNVEMHETANKEFEQDR